MATVNMAGTCFGITVANFAFDVDPKVAVLFQCNHRLGVDQISMTGDSSSQ